MHGRSIIIVKKARMGLPTSPFQHYQREFGKPDSRCEIIWLKQPTGPTPIEKLKNNNNGTQ